MDKASSLIGGLVTVALVTTIVAHKHSAAVVSAGGRAIAGLFLSSQGIVQRGYRRV